jgi:hypothetical protein
LPSVPLTQALRSRGKSTTTQPVAISIPISGYLKEEA